MAYVKTEWVNGSTALSAEHMNHIETGIKEVHDFMDQLVDSLWPVGSIYMSTSAANPNTRPLLAGTTWVAWGSGKVPVGVNGSDTDFKTVEKSGGAKTVTLSESNMPSHTHTYNKANATSGSTAITVNQMPSHTHTQKGHTHSVPAHRHEATKSGSLATETRFLQYHTSTGGVRYDTASNLPAEGSSADWRDFPYVKYSGQGGEEFWTGSLFTAYNDAQTTGSTTATNNNTGGGAGHTHSVGTASANTGSKGSGSAVNNLQPYITCYMWKRTG